VVQTHYTRDFLSRTIEHDVATFVGTIRALGRETVPATYILVKEGERWVIQDFHF